MLVTDKGAENPRAFLRRLRSWATRNGFRGLAFGAPCHAYGTAPGAPEGAWTVYFNGTAPHGGGWYFDGSKWSDNSDHEYAGPRPREGEAR